MTREHWAEQTESEVYRDFVEKFKPKKTTDDCYTPDNIYDAVAGFVAKRYGLDRAHFVRPFYPGGDFERFPYDPGSVVVDNPPFSILAAILRFYMAQGIRFFLFANTLTLFHHLDKGVCAVPVGVKITYENGAAINTSFLTNLDGAAIVTEPELYRALDAANRENERAMHKELPKYVYPPNVLTTAEAARWCKYGVAFRAARASCRRIPAMDAQRKVGKSIFGSGVLLSDALAEEASRAAAMSTRAAVVWSISDREREIIRELGKEERA